MPQSSNADDSYNTPADYANLDEVADTSPVENPDENALYQHNSLESERDEERDEEEGRRHSHKTPANRDEPSEKSKGDEDEYTNRNSKLATQLYTISYLIIFSLFGTLVRLGLQAITSYPGAPVIFSELWANFGGSVCMGFLLEDRKLFREEWGTPKYNQELERSKLKHKEEGIDKESPVDLQAAKKAHGATKKTIPLFIGLSTGFCGCFTSFSSFIRDSYLAMSNELSTPATSIVQRNGGYSFMALLAVIIVTVTLCVSALKVGAHIAILTEPYTPSIPFVFGRKILDRFAVFLAWGCWLGAIILAIFPPDRKEGPPEIWRGRAVLALVFAPLGCLGRFYASIYLNGKISSFPLGTFLVNIFGTIIIGMSYDLQHVPLGGVIGCQVLQGIEDGFCGCLTTVSTWVSELSSLRRRHAYIYGGASVIVALCFLIVIMGSMQWTIGLSKVLCVH